MPVLVYVLHYPVKQAVPMSLIVVGLASLFGIVNHHRHHNIRWDAALAFGPAAIVGAFLGARWAFHVTARFQLGLFATIMLAAAVSMYFGPSLWHQGSPEPRPRRPLPVVMVLGGGVGMLTGLVGVGGGFMYVPSLVMLGGLAMKDAVGTSLVLIVLSSLTGLLSYLGVVSLDWAAVGLFAGIAIAGVVVGSALVRHVSQAGLRRGFAILLLVMGILVLVRR